jgi:hypothetical protein
MPGKVVRGLQKAPEERRTDGRCNGAIGREQLMTSQEEESAHDDYSVDRKF